MKISIIIPTYNDSKYILDTLKSIETQSYNNYEVIIVNDGSTDDTETIIRNYINSNPKITYIYQDNQDQLKAILNGSKYITGEIVFILHSDDVLASDDVLQKANDYFIEKNVDAIIGNLILVDKNLNYLNTQKVDVNRNNYAGLLTYLYLGRNIYCDTAFVKKSVFLTEVKDNYLTWNMPFWLKQNGETINVLKVDFEFVKYRQSESNYILNDLGKLNVMNGELRVINTLSNVFYIPLYEFQFNLYRLFKKLHLSYSPLWKKEPTKNKYPVFKYVMEKRYTKKEIMNNIYLNALLHFYKNKNNRTVNYNFKKEYYGCDIREFNKKLLSNELEPEYVIFFEEMNKGFSKIITKDKDKTERVLKFLNISGVEIEVQNDT